MGGQPSCPVACLSVRSGEPDGVPIDPVEARRTVSAGGWGDAVRRLAEAGREGPWCDVWGGGANCENAEAAAGTAAASASGQVCGGAIDVGCRGAHTGCDVAAAPAGR